MQRRAWQTEGQALTVPEPESTERAQYGSIKEYSLQVLYGDPKYDLRYLPELSHSGLPGSIMDSRAIFRLDRGFYVGSIVWVGSMSELTRNIDQGSSRPRKYVEQWRFGLYLELLGPLPKASVAYTLALKGLLYRHFGVYVYTIQRHGAFWFDISEASR